MKQLKYMRFKLFIIAILASVSAAAQYVQPMMYLDYTLPGQINIGNGVKKATAPSAYLEIGPTGTGSKGFLPPRLSQAQRDAITSPATWLTIINTSTGEWNIYNGSSWVVPSIGISSLGAGNCLIQVNDSTYRVDTSCVLTKWQYAKTRDSLLALIALKLNISDTSGKWVSAISKTGSNDSIIFYIGATRYAIPDRGGGGGAGGGISELGTSGITCLTRLNDSTYAVDTACAATKLYVKHYADSIAALKQNQLNGTGFVKATSGVISYDNTTYEAAFTETIEEFTGSTSGTVTVSQTPKTSKARIVYFNGVRMQNSNVSIAGTGFTISGISRETDDIITVKYSY